MDNVISVPGDEIVFVRKGKVQKKYKPPSSTVRVSCEIKERIKQIAIDTGLGDKEIVDKLLLYALDRVKMV